MKVRILLLTLRLILHSLNSIKIQPLNIYFYNQVSFSIWLNFFKEAFLFDFIYKVYFSFFVLNFLTGGAVYFILSFYNFFQLYSLWVFIRHAQSSVFLFNNWKTVFLVLLKFFSVSFVLVFLI